MLEFFYIVLATLLMLPGITITLANSKYEERNCCRKACIHFLPIFLPLTFFFIAAAKLFIFESCMSHPLPFKVAILSCKKNPKNVEGVGSDKRSLMILDIPSDFSHSYHPYWNTILFICELNHMAREWADRALGLAHDGL